MKLYASIMILTLVVFSSANANQATCSWVLWSRLDSFSWEGGSPREKEGAWKVERAIKTMQQCESMIKTYIKIETEREVHPSVERKVASGDTTGMIITSGKDKEGYPMSFTKHFLCLPDTVDPRGPKH